MTATRDHRTVPCRLWLRDEPVQDDWLPDLRLFTPRTHIELAIRQSLWESEERRRAEEGAERCGRCSRSLAFSEAQWAERELDSGSILAFPFCGQCYEELGPEPLRQLSAEVPVLRPREMDCPYCRALVYRRLPGWGETRPYLNVHVCPVCGRRSAHSSSPVPRDGMATVVYDALGKPVAVIGV
jgi:hypothetical protein